MAVRSIENLLEHERGSSGPAFDSYTERRVQSRNSNLRFTSSKVSAPIFKKGGTAKDSPHSTCNMGDEKEHMMQSKSFTLLKSPK